MKEANNNEVDLLLRSLANHPRTSAKQTGSGDGKMAASNHLDADELNSYAEGVVPAAARARYTEHLADCDSCRSIVVSLSQASGLAVSNVPEPKAEAGFWQKLSAFFSPAVLRFAVPALMLAVVIGVGLLALRRPQTSEFIAQNAPAETPAPVNAVTNTPSSQAPPASSGTPQVPSGSTAVDTTRDQKPATGEAEDRKLATRPITELPAESTVAKAPAKDDLNFAKDAERAGVSPYALEPKAAPPAPTTILSDADKRADLAKEAQTKSEGQQTSRDEFRQREEVHGPNRAQSNIGSNVGSANVAGRNSGGLMSAKRGPSDANMNKKAANVETRSVSGRSFTREGNAWVDTAYESGSGTTRVTRGSEQYRALVADEPGLRTISEQLNGVVIVVWKNRAYRIQ